MTDDNTLAGRAHATPTSAHAGAVEAALERVVAAARAHLTAIRAADGERDDDAVWDAYVALNNASHGYDDLLNAVFGEVTPWDLEAISGDEDPAMLTVSTGDGGPGRPGDPYPHVVSVRQRRDYRVPSVSALLRLAEEGRAPATEDEVLEPVATVGEAVLELLQSGDGSLGMLDVPELVPLDGVVIVAEVGEELNVRGVDTRDLGDRDLGPDALGGAEGEPDGEALFRLTGTDRVVGRLDERALPDPEA